MARMLRVTGRILIGLASLVLILAVLASAFAFFTVRRSFPKTGGQVQLAGLDAPVDVYRDGYGIPQIYAETTHDLFFTQGYVHAQDRFYQMDYWRHIGSARLSEMFGSSLVETDAFLRTLGWARVAQQEEDGLGSETRAILQSYADGVNAYLASHAGSALSLEYALLKLSNGDYQVEPWQVLNTLTWAKSMAWDLKSNMSDEIERAVLLRSLTPEQVDEVFPPYPQGHPVIVAEATSGQRLAKDDPGMHSTRLAFNEQPLATGVATDLGTGMEAVSSRFTRLDRLLGAMGEGIGSNNWVISGERTATGKPFLANDPHLGVQMPSIWYEIGLHCVPKGPACPFDVTGFSFAGAPAVIIGHNDRIAWGMTNLGPDVMDLYIEKINPQNPNQYEVNGQWVDMETLKETIQVAGGDPVEVTVRTTRHGPVISDSYGPLKDFDQKAGTDLPEPFAIALRWTALEPSYLFRAFLGFNLAQNWEQFREAARDLTVPAQNLVYADVDGNIGYQAPGNIPLRASGDGRLPVPGWTDAYEWKGYLPFDQLPFSYNPPQGYIATANNPIIGPDYRQLITTDWDYGYRAKRIVEMIEGAPGPIDSAYIQKMQGDSQNMFAAFLVPPLMGVDLKNAQLEERRTLLQGWDGQMKMDSAPAALFAVFWKNLVNDTLRDDLPEAYWPAGGGRTGAMLQRLVEQPDSTWWDDRNTAAQERRDDILRRAFGEAVQELEGAQGQDPARWNWGDLHTVTFVNPTLGQSGNPQIESLFNRGPFRTAGGNSIVNATNWYFNTAEGPYDVRALPSMRMIVDLGNLQDSLAIHTTGESGHAYNPHYIDMADLWRNIQYHPMLWELAQVEASSKEHLRLLP